MIQDSGSVGTDDDVVERLSRGTRLVSLYHNVEADDRFLFAANGVIQVGFDPRDPRTRTGARPGLLLDAMRASGLDLDGHHPDPGDPGYRDVPHLPAALAMFGAFLLAWRRRPFAAGLAAGASPASV